MQFLRADAAKIALKKSSLPLGAGLGVGEIEYAITLENIWLFLTIEDMLGILFIRKFVYFRLERSVHIMEVKMFKSIDQVESRHFSVEATVAPGGWCCSCCCWCWVNIFN